MLSSQPEVSSLPLPKGIWPLMIIGIAFASEIAALLSLKFISILSNYSLGRDQFIFLIDAPLVGLTTGLFCWWFFVVKPGRLTVMRGILTGALSGLIAHPFIWMSFAFLSSMMGDDFFSIHQMKPFSFLFLLFSFSVMSLIFVGWITAIVGGAVGGLLLYCQLFRTRPGAMK